MSSFNLYLQLGIHHILDLKGYDHILFLIVLCAIYKLNDWKKILVLITAFTIGHTSTLLLATLDYINIKTELIEFLIPVTIIITAIANFFYNSSKTNSRLNQVRYLASLFFGLIHGLGFSNYIRGLLGNEVSILKPLFAFNIGIEIGQLFVVFILFGLIFLISLTKQISSKSISIVLSMIGLAVSIVLAWNRIPTL